MKTLIIIPTYNEKENIENIINAVFDLRIPDISILIVDDNSPDGTAKIVESLQKKFNNLHIIKRAGKLGLGSAYIEGFKFGLKQGFETIIQMDADFSHPITKLPEMINLSNEYDFVIGSRYVKGGGVKDWPIIRRILSRGGSLYARLILGQRINDFTGGFNTWNKRVLEKINLNQIKSNGYVFQIEMKYRAKKLGFSHIETPIIFTDRTAGKSKMSKRIALEAMVKTILIKFTK
ncbi:polyprenol monophosphomannose synthase [Candidatus Falkowbacteria bacterium]|nr:polyprenol monophosphomannose synthase [Candidatus Falkowbacteria bacterium]MBT7007745.1 polyprenol monophosphomannose synthase [Candidatus Falkowbacteria bacterium]